MSNRRYCLFWNDNGVHSLYFSVLNEAVARFNQAGDKAKLIWDGPFLYDYYAKEMFSFWNEYFTCPFQSMQVDDTTNYMYPRFAVCSPNKKQLFSSFPEAQDFFNASQDVPRVLYNYDIVMDYYGPNAAFSTVKDTISSPLFRLNTSYSYAIQSIDNNLVIDNDYGNSTGKVILWQATAKSYQQWSFIDAGDGSYFIKNVSSGKVLEYPMSAKAGDKVSEKPQTDRENQKWNIVFNQSGNFKIVAAKSNPPLGITSTESEATLGADNDTNSRIWRFINSQPLASSFDQFDQYIIQSKLQNFVLEVDGDKVIQKKFVKNKNEQLWNIVPSTQGSFVFRNVGKGTVIECDLNFSQAKDLKAGVFRDDNAVKWFLLYNSNDRTYILQIGLL